jgi:hypothetical protein
MSEQQDQPQQNPNDQQEQQEQLEQLDQPEQFNPEEFINQVGEQIGELLEKGPRAYLESASAVWPPLAELKVEALKAGEQIASTVKTNFEKVKNEVSGKIRPQIDSPQLEELKSSVLDLVVFYLTEHDSAYPNRSDMLQHIKDNVLDSKENYNNLLNILSDKLRS